MNKDEVLGLMAIINDAYYQQYSKIPTTAKDSQIKLWCLMFKEDDADIVTKALLDHIATDTKGFIPLIGQLKEKIYKINNPDELSEQEAINLIMHAVSNSHKPEEAFVNLPKILQRIVGRPWQLYSWGLMDIEIVQSVIASNVGRSYRTMLKTQQEKQVTGKYTEEQIEAPEETKQIETMTAQPPSNMESIRDIIAGAIEKVKKVNEARRI